MSNLHYIPPISYETFHERTNTLTDRRDLYQYIEGTRYVPRLITLFDVEAQLCHHELVTQNLRHVARALFQDIEDISFRNQTRQFWSGNRSFANRERTPAPDSDSSSGPQQTIDAYANMQSPGIINLDTGEHGTRPNYIDADGRRHIVIVDDDTPSPDESITSHIGVPRTSNSGEISLESVPRINITEYVDNILLEVATSNNTINNGGTLVHADLVTRHIIQ
ncbi:hypothetical protein HYPSUDRAFT_199393 [Hypholoma sublateritium FD-334 SS-4]|uniref:Uncharacterized protein n=1 Tax=Hypholoma sublateritium (strain FD-334 SS-4) TaxID=945553 RepID=A0A0D2PAR0_HYPSF|nr:hypothetical protein HYPSUDRAFT_199393 [Hypholoma sublateritium FD-334 SS-4]